MARSVKPKPRQGAEPAFVYFIEAVGSRAVKIGIAADPIARLRSLQCGSHQELRLLGVVHAEKPKDVESHLHFEFWPERKRGEWFRRSRRLSALIEGAVPYDEHASSAVSVLDGRGVSGFCRPNERIEDMARRVCRVAAVMGYVAPWGALRRQWPALAPTGGSDE